jgi:hypothetical protein
MGMLNWHAPPAERQFNRDHMRNLIRFGLIALFVGFSTTACERPQTICSRQDLQEGVLSLLHREAFGGTFGDSEEQRSSLNTHFKLTISLGLLKIDQVRFVSFDKQSELVTCGGTVRVADPYLDGGGKRVIEWRSYEVAFTRQPAASGEGFLMSVSPSEPAAESIGRWMYDGEVAKMFKAARTGGATPAEPQSPASPEEGPATTPASASAEEEVDYSRPQQTMIDGIHTHSDYNEARLLLVAKGWKPTPVAPAKRECSGQALCTYDEIYYCADDEQRLCDAFFSRRGSTIVVTVQHQADNNIIVTDIRYPITRELMDYFEN